ncbi:MAG: hypothetical protein LBB72_05320 [Spirochaetaceae bacterium]|jgi:hypothetical protein|nr:hypothetical protein [Spirochaetaceae bacterium]
MKKYAVLLFILAEALYAQLPPDTGSSLEAGKTAALGVEATTTFAWDLEKNSTGLLTRAGMELIFPLFPGGNWGVYPEDAETPAVRLALRNASFLWWVTYQTKGGNYEQDNFNSWTARPLILTFGSFNADVVWKNYFFRIAGTGTEMRTDMVSIRSIFDEVMDVNDRFYYAQDQALWRADRYNIQDFPLLKGFITRDYVDQDYRGNVSGTLAAGAEFETWSLALKTASKARGEDNTDNAWLIGADIELVPIENLKAGLTGFAAVNYDKAGEENPYTAGASVEYRLPLSELLILAPFAGFDFYYEKKSEKTQWEAGGGVFLYTRGYDYKASYRILDYDDVIPLGFSASLNTDQDSNMNAIISWFDTPDRDSLIPWFGGFLQAELGNIMGNGGKKMDYAVMAQIEYALFEGKITPYIRGGYTPEIKSGSRTGDRFINSALGIYITPFHNFSVDISYKRQDKQTVSNGMVLNNGLVSAAFTIRM